MNIRLYQSLLELQVLRQIGSSQPVQPLMQNSFASLLQNEMSNLTAPRETKNAGLIREMPLQMDTFEAASPPGARVNAAEETPEGYRAIIEEMASKYNVDPTLITSVIQHESGFQADSVSHAGAMGLMQLMPETASWLGVTDPFNPRQNIEGGTKYLRDMLDKYDGNKALALAAYNAGPGNVDKYGGVPPFKETRNYVSSVLNNYTAV